MQREREHFDAVVVGSGFGGSVTAYRLAEAGLRVCLLERGKPYPPGSFPRTPDRMKKNFWDPSRGLFGLFNAWSFNEFGALVTSGLGGGSLIFANALLRKDEKWFVRDRDAGGHEHWPVTRADLDPHYDAVEAMLGATRYPLDQPPYSRTPKTRAMIEAAEKLRQDPRYAGDLTWELPNLAVTFASPGDPPTLGEPIREEPARRNLHGVTRSTCRLCGECNFGCNYGSKNTLDYNYLTEAKRLGAEIRTLCEVRSLAPRDGGGYSVDYVVHDVEREGRNIDTSSLPVRAITCDKLILAAGTLGSTFLLLKSKDALPGLSGTIGSRFCGNGDLMGNVIRSHETKGDKRQLRVMDPTMGPVITMAMRFRDRAEGGSGRGYYLEDAGFPAFLSWLLEVSEAPGAASALVSLGQRFLKNKLGIRQKTDIAGELGEMFGPCSLSSASFPMLGMGRDTPDGRLFLEDGHLDLKYAVESSGAHYERVRNTMKDIADALDAEYADNLPYYLSRVITVHPLGGCPMGRDASEGVVSAWGEVFNHPGLFVADGSVMPGPVGANPSLTIAALADRFADGILDPGRRASGALQATALRPNAARSSAVHDADTTLSFTEEMKGYVTFGGTEDYDRGYREGRENGGYIMFRLTITVRGVDRFVVDPAHEATPEGYIKCDALGGELPVLGGLFNLFVDQGDTARKCMRYRLYFRDREGKPLTLTGFKDIKDDPGFDLWSDTTTLFTRILRGHVGPVEPPDVEIVASGIIKIHITDFMKQLTTFRTTGPTISDRASALEKFGRLFLGNLWDIYARDILTSSPV